VQTIRFLSLALCACAAWMFGAEAAWNTKAVANWTDQDAQQILQASPWSKVVVAGIARRETESERREGGNMGQPHGVGYDGIDDRKFHPEALGNPFGGAPYTPAPTPVIRLLVRWESALPIRAAEFKAHETGPPTLSDEGYTIAVYGVPGTYFKGDPKKLGDPFKELAALKREGKKDVKPTSVEVFQLEGGAAVVYRFPSSAEISTRDTLIEFAALIGRLQVSQVFHLDEMQYQGKLEL
jgi:hypothetical protein